VKTACYRDVRDQSGVEWFIYDLKIREIRDSALNPGPGNPGQNPETQDSPLKY
jgi:hypothetical protein